MVKGSARGDGKEEKEKLDSFFFLPITPRTFFSHASRVFSACNPNRDTCELVSCRPAICWCRFLQKVILTPVYFYSRIKAKRKIHLKGTHGMIYACLNG